MGGVFSDFPEEFYEDPITEDESDSSDDEYPSKQEVQEYFKVGIFCGMTPLEFEQTPLLWRDAISKEIDRRLKPYIESLESKASKRSGGKKGKQLLPIDFNHLAILLALTAALGGGDD